MATYVGGTQGANQNTPGANLKTSSKYTSAGETVDWIEAYVDGLGTGSGSSSLQLAIFTDSAGVPSARSAQTTNGDITVSDGAAAAWVGAAITPTVLPTTFWLAILGDNGRYRIYSTTGSFGDEKYNADTYPDMSDPYSGASTDSSLLSIRARVQGTSGGSAKNLTLLGVG